MPLPVQESELVADVLYKAVRKVNSIANRIPSTEETPVATIPWNEVAQNHLKKQASLTAIPSAFVNALRNYKATLSHGVSGFKQLGSTLVSSPRSMANLYGRSVKNSWTKGNRVTAPFKGVSTALRAGLGADQARGIGAIKSLTLKGTALAGGTYLGNKFYNDKQDMLRQAYSELGPTA